jgi:uncharacterized protein YndB with AHSA1/START domain
MTEQSTTTWTPIRKHVTVEAPQERAFDVFTRRMGSWWNPDHRLGDQPLADVVVEPREGGRWYEVGTDGAECQWGRVLAWEPHGRVLLAWQLNGQWDYDPDFVTELEIRFVAEGPTSTRVELEHRDLERFGADAAAVRDSLDSPNGWAGLLARFGGGLASEG